MQGGEKGAFLMDLCIGIKFCWNANILSRVPGLAVALESGTIKKNFLTK